MMPKFTLHTTGTCGESRHPEIVIPLDEALGLAPKWLIQYFETAVRSGRIFQPEETVQIGGGLVRLHEADNGTLELWEPDFKSMPIHWVRGANETLRQLILQKSVPELVRTEPDFASLMHAGQVPDGWPELRVFEMHRNDPEGNHIGWSVETLDQPATKLVSIYDLVRQLPICMPFLALPPGSNIELSPARIDIEYRGRSTSSAESELLNGFLAPPAG